MFSLCLTTWVGYKNTAKECILILYLLLKWKQFSIVFRKFNKNSWEELNEWYLDGEYPLEYLLHMSGVW